MVKKPDSNKARLKRHMRVRAKISGGTPERPRLSVFRSAKHIYAQIIDDCERRNSRPAPLPWRRASKASAATRKLPQGRRGCSQGCTCQGFPEVVFDRSGYIYHGRVQELAEGAREGGLEILR